MFSRALKYLEKNRPDKAIPLFKKELAEKEYKEAYLNLGNSYRLLDRHTDALLCYLKAADSSTPFYDGKYSEHYDLALSNLGLHSYMMGRDDEAIEFYQACLKANPLHYDCIWNYSNTLLRKWCAGQDIDAAWKMYSYRFKRNNAVIIDSSVPLWDGVSRVKKLCVLAEQGIGDKIMFGRYIHKLREYADTIVVQSPSYMKPFLMDFETTEGTAASVKANCGVPICSLASKFETSSIVNGRRVLYTPHNWLPKFEPRKFDGNNLKIGVVWSGSTSHANNRNRSIPAGYFSRLTNYGDVYYLGLDGTCPRGIKNIGSSDWSETCASLLGLDLLISCDTSIVHAAGSLDVKTWMLQPLCETDFRWGYGGRSCWYPSVEVFQNPGDWEKMFAVVCARLAEEKAKFERERMIGHLLPLVAEVEGRSLQQVRSEMGLD